MNKEEAIERIKQNKAAAEFYAQMISNYRSAENELKDIEAFNMAIEALLTESQGDSISRFDAKDKAKEIIYSILDDTDYNDIESMAHACVMMKIKILKMFDEFPSTNVVSHEDFVKKGETDNKLYLNPICRSCKHEGYCHNIPVDENNKDIEYYDIYGRPVFCVTECKNYEKE